MGACIFRVFKRGVMAVATAHNMICLLFAHHPSIKPSSKKYTNKHALLTIIVTQTQKNHVLF